VILSREVAATTTSREERGVGDGVGVYISFIGIHTLCDSVTRGYGDHSPLTTAAILEWRRRSAWGCVAAAAREGEEPRRSAFLFFFHLLHYLRGRRTEQLSAP